MKVKLGEIAVLINGDRGKNYPSQADIVPNGEIPFVNAGHLNGRNISFDEMNYISQEKFEQLNSGKFFKGDILYCLRGSLGKKAAVKDDVKGAIASSLVIIRPDSEKVDVDYLMFALDSPSIKEQLLKANNGSSQPNLSAASVRAYDIDLPGKEIQEEVVAKLSKVRTIIDARQQELQKLDELIKARFVEMFGDVKANSKGWETRPLKEICDISRGGSPRPIVNFLGGTIPWIKIGDATDGDSIYITSTKEHIIEEGIRKSRYIKSGSLIFANCGVSLGFCRIITFDGCIHDGWLAFQNIDDSIDKIFLLMTINQLTDYFRSIAPGGTQPNLNTEIMGNYQQIIPPMELQKEYIEFVEQVDKSKSAIQKALDEAQLLFDSLMQKYFG